MTTLTVAIDKPGKLVRFQRWGAEMATLRWRTWALAALWVEAMLAPGCGGRPSNLETWPPDDHYVAFDVQDHEIDSASGEEVPWRVLIYGSDLPATMAVQLHLLPSGLSTDIAVLTSYAYRSGPPPYSATFKVTAPRDSSGNVLKGLFVMIACWVRDERVRYCTETTLLVK